MTIYVVVGTFQGVITDIRAFLTEQSARKAEQEWLKQYRIKDKAGRECKSQDGTELILQECELKT